MNQNLAESDRAQVEAACALVAQHLGRNLMAVHLYGSAIDGGLQFYSDIDLLVTVREPIDGQQRKALMNGLLKISAFPGASSTYRALEVTVVVYAHLVPWRFPPLRDMQFGEWLRDDIRAGVYEPMQADPDIAILLTKVRKSSVALIGEKADMVFAAVPKSDLFKTFRYCLDLWQERADLKGDERNIILTLARIWYSVVTGEMIGKDKAAAWLLPQLSEAHAATLQAARSEYLGVSTMDWSAAMPSVERFVWFAKAQIIELLGKIHPSD